VAALPAWWSASGLGAFFD